MAERGDSSDEEMTIAEDVVVTKYQMAADMANREQSDLYTECCRLAFVLIRVNNAVDGCLFIIFYLKCRKLFLARCTY